MMTCYATQDKINDHHLVDQTVISGIIYQPLDFISLFFLYLLSPGQLTRSEKAKALQV